MKTILATLEIAQLVYPTKQEIAEVAALPAEDLDAHGMEFVGLEGIPLEVILQTGCYNSDCTGGCG